VIEPRLNDAGDPYLSHSGTAVVAGKSAASWPAIIAGAFVAASVSLILLVLGAGLGFAAMSPWPGHGVSATTFSVTTAIWLIVTQWLSAAVGGYIAGRLRTRWIGTHTHEVFFRDTAHGLITWSVATVLIAAALAASAFGAAGGGLRAAAEAASGPAQGREPNAMSAESAYALDKLFRPVAAAPAVSASGINESRAETGRIIVNAIANGGVPDSDRSYLADLVAARAGIPAAVAQSRVDDFVTASLAAADKARKAAAEASIYMALAMLIGAFIASVSAALGGRLRDEHP
jgi:hypothetical protein